MERFPRQNDQHCSELLNIILNWATMRRVPPTELLATYLPLLTLTIFAEAMKDPSKFADQVLQYGEALFATFKNVSEGARANPKFLDCVKDLNTASAVASDGDDMANIKPN